LYKRTSKNEAPGSIFGTTDATGAFWWQEEENRKIKSEAQGITYSKGRREAFSIHPSRHPSMDSII
jgi:hypothetical protein